MLAARFRAPLPLLAGMALATLANHSLAGLGGAWLADLLGPRPLVWALGLSFLAMAAWMLIPDRIAESELAAASRRGAFLASLLAFFLLEIGEKTQVATVALAARLEPLAAVVAGSTLGLVLANGPVILLGERVAALLAFGWARLLAALTFALVGIVTLLTGLG